jgi:hypothetical protein
MSEETAGKRFNKTDFDKVERFIVKVRVAEVGNLSPKEMSEFREKLKMRGEDHSVMDVMREEAIERGIEIGLGEGIDRGIIKGRVEGLTMGLEDGIKIGVGRGRDEERRKLAIKLKAENVSLSIISRTTGLTIEELTSL